MSLPTLLGRPSWRRAPRVLSRLLLASLLTLLQGHAPPRRCPVSEEIPIRPGESDEHTFTLAPGDFLGIVVEQAEIDVTLELFDPRGRKIGKSDRNDFWLWEEEMALLAERPGSYKLKIIPSNGYSPPGAYRIQVDGPRRLRAGDRTRLAALRAMREAGEAYRYDDETRLTRLEEARKRWRELGNERRQAEILYQMGDSLHRLGRLEESVQRFEDSIALWEKIGNPDRRAWTLCEIWQPKAKLFRKGEAKAHLEEALDFARTEKLKRLEEYALYKLGRMHEQQPRAAARYLEQALPVARENGDPERELRVSYQLGYTYEDLAEKQAALRQLEHALGLARKLNDPWYQPTILNNLGFIYASLGHQEKAVESYTEALRLSQNDPHTRVAILNNLAHLYERGEPERARQMYGRTLALARDHGDVSMEATAVNNLAFLELRAGNPARALRLSREALQLARGNKILECPIRQALGIAYRELGQLPESRDELETALALSRESYRVREGVIIPELARTELKAGELRRALRLLESGIQIVESVRTKLVEDELRAHFLASRQDTYALYIDTLMVLHRAEPERGFDAEALRTSERARARTLLDILSESGAEIGEGAPPALRAGERRLRARIETLEGRRLELQNNGASSREIDEATRQLRRAIDEHQRVEDELRRRIRRYADLTQPQPLSLAEIQEQVLDSQALLLEYALGKERSYLWAVTPDALRSYELPSKARIEQAARRYSAALRINPDKNRDPAVQTELSQAAAALSDMLLRPVAPLLDGQPLLVVSDGALQYIPFSALPMPSTSPGAAGALLIDRHEVVNLPSASVLAVQRRELAGRKPAPRTLALLGDPVFQKGDLRVVRALSRSREQGRLSPVSRVRSGDTDPRKLRRLPFAEWEAREITALVPERERLTALGFAASRATVTSGRLADFRMVHFATHGVIDSRRPELSSLVLSLVDERGKPQNGFLRLHDIYNLKLNADLVVLSACETALGQEVRGEGLIGLTRGFMYAGAARVLASLWTVDDRATSVLMKRFYEHKILDGMNPAAALRQAQAEMSRDPRWSSPYYWAGFSLQGEWR